MNALSDAALQAYRQLVTEPGFLEYFDQATPIGEIEQLPIGSRPARRGGQRSLDKLRAIPWVFSWTQNRQLLPAWFGIGAAIANFLGLHRDGLEKLRTMYRQWPFFAGVIENAALALAKADLGIGAEYLRLVKDPRVAQAIWDRIQHDYHASVSGVLQITGRTGLLSDVAWLRDSIEVRNPYVDPLNLMQVALLERARRDQDSEEIAAELQALIRATIQGIAAGLRTTG
jgi:phosphoenolpyruvate carboxylase